MSLVKKLKDILFEEEEYTEPQKVKEELKEERTKQIKVETEEHDREEMADEVTSERKLFNADNSFKFPDFDEEEFASSVESIKPSSNILEYERKKTVEKRTDYGRYERVETKETTDKKKFKPSPIISPVYGILNQDYKAEDIVRKEENASNIDIDMVRKKAFEQKVNSEINRSEEIDEPVVTFFEEKETIKITEKKEKEKYKSIDDLLEEAAEEISLEDTLEIPKTNNLDAIEEELEKIEFEEKEDTKELDDTLDSDLYELIDSMYENREEE